jgi:predicted transcriptional regulator
MSHRRSKLEIQLNILSSVMNGVDKPTRIMYAANMSWRPVQRNLSHLVDKGLLERQVNLESSKSKSRYVITEKGINVLEYFKKAKEILPIKEIYS